MLVVNDKLFVSFIGITTVIVLIASLYTNDSFRDSIDKARANKDEEFLMKADHFFTGK